MGQTDLEDNSQYRSIVSKNNQVKSLEQNYIGDQKLIGLSGIFNYKEFWSSMVVSMRDPDWRIFWFKKFNFQKYFAF